MRKLLVILIFACLIPPVSAGAARGSGETAGKGTVKKQKKKTAKKRVEQLRRQGEKDAARHRAQMMRREYQLMMEAQQRGMSRRPPQGN